MEGAAFYYKKIEGLLKVPQSGTFNNPSLTFTVYIDHVKPRRNFNRNHDNAS